MRNIVEESFGDARVRSGGGLVAGTPDGSTNLRVARHCKEDQKDDEAKFQGYKLVLENNKCNGRRRLIFEVSLRSKIGSPCTPQSFALGSFTPSITLCRKVPLQLSCGSGSSQPSWSWEQR